MDVGFSNELVEESVPLLVRYFVLNGDKGVLKVHDGAIERG